MIEPTKTPLRGDPSGIGPEMNQAMNQGMNWVKLGSCTKEDPELFFPVGTSGPAAEQTARAIAICLACPVRAICLEWALDTCQDAGVWGGLDEEQRRQIRRARRRARETKTTAGALVAVG